MKKLIWGCYLVLWILLTGCAGIDRLTPPLKLAVIRFQLAHKAAHSVCVSGDFNNWSTTGNCMHIEAGQWTLSMPLKPGTYRYGFVLDGQKWMADPQGLWLEKDGFGRLNAVIVVPE